MDDIPPSEERKGNQDNNISNIGDFNPGEANSFNFDDPENDLDDILSQIEHGDREERGTLTRGGRGGESIYKKTPINLPTSPISV